MKKTIVQSVAAITGASAIVVAATSTQAVTLDEVLRDVVVTNPMILEKQKAYNIAVAEQGDARSSYFPKAIFTGNVGYKAYRDGEVDDDEERIYDEETGEDITGYTDKHDGFYDARLTISQLLFDFGKTSSLAEARKNFMLAALYAYIGEASQVSYDTIVAYLNVLKFNELRQLAMENVLVHQNLLEGIRKQVELGKKGRSELERINGRMASAQSRLLLRRNDYKKAVFTLHKLLGRFVSVQEMVMPKMDVAVLPASLKEALDLQVKFNPLLREAYYSVAQKQCEHRNKKGGYFGKLSVEGSASIENEFEPSDEYETEAKIGLRYEQPIFDAGVGDRVDAAIGEVHKEQQKRYRVRRTLLNDIQMSWSAYKLLTEQIGILKKNLYFTGKVLESYKKEFTLGRRSLINILDAQNENYYASQQLVDSIYSREAEKYRVLLSEGVLLSTLGLLDPAVEAMIEKDDRYQPLGDDELPLTDDFDADTVLDDHDVSVNSLKESVVNELGIARSYDSSYIYQQDKAKKGEEIVIGAQDQLKKKPLQLNTTMRFDFDAFLPEGVGLSETMTGKMMKELVHQARKYSAKSPLFIMVGTNEYDDVAKNYSLSLKRAYTLKRILQQNRIEDKGIFVYGDNRAAKGHNSLRLKFTDALADYQKQYEVHSVSSALFMQGSEEIADRQQLAKLVAAVSQNSDKAEIILYSNELDDMEANHQLGLRRAAFLRKYLAEKGLDADRVTLFSWGSFQEDPLIPEAKRVPQFLQYVLR